MHYITVPTLLLEDVITRAKSNPCTATAVFDPIIKGLRELRPEDAEGMPLPTYHCTRPAEHVDGDDPVHIAHGLWHINAAWIETDGSASELATTPFARTETISAGVCLVTNADGYSCTRTAHSDELHLASTMEGAVVYAWLTERVEDMAVEA